MMKSISRGKPLYNREDRVFFGEDIDFSGATIKADLNRCFERMKFFDDSYYGGQSSCTLEKVTENEIEGPFIRIKGQSSLSDHLSDRWAAWF